MVKTKRLNPSDFIVPLNINGLEGRMLKLPATKKKTREILFIYGHHSNLERWWGVIEYLGQYGNVTVPDLPGFGGMDSLYKVGQPATIDNLADYLAAFIKLRYKRKKVTIAGLSFGFVVVTRMLQRNPDLVNKVELLVSVVGFSRKDDFTFSKTRHTLYRYGAALFSTKLTALFFRYIFLNEFVLRLAYAKTHNAREKFHGMSKEDIKRTMDFEILLWQSNDVRTHMKTVVEILTLDNCHERIDMPLWHIMPKQDRYFDHDVVEQHLKIIFKDVKCLLSDMESHGGSILADKKQAASMFPAKLRKVLN